MEIISKDYILNWRIEMGIIKILFYIIILSTSTLLGFSYGGFYKKRAQSLLDLGYCIRILESEILVGNIPLPEALHNVYNKGRGDIKYIFKMLIEDLFNEEREDIYFSFLSLKNIFKNKYLLNDNDIEVLLFLGKVLGKSNRTYKK